MLLTHIIQKPEAKVKNILPLSFYAKIGGTERSAHTKITVTRTKAYAVSAIMIAY